MSDGDGECLGGFEGVSGVFAVFQDLNVLGSLNERNKKFTPKHE